MTIAQLKQDKQEYNRLLKRFRKAEAIEENLTEAHLRGLSKLVKDMNTILSQFENLTEYEIQNGFDID